MTNDGIIFRNCLNIERLSHIAVLVLKVGLAVVTNDPVRVRRRVRLRVGRGHLASQVVVETLEETLAQVHVSNGVDAFWELNRAGQLSISVAPVVLNAFQVPLVDQDHNLLALCLVYLLEQILVLFVHEDLLELGEEDRRVLGVPV